MSDLSKQAKTFSQIENQFSPDSDRKWVLLEAAQKEIETLNGFYEKMRDHRDAWFKKSQEFEAKVAAAKEILDKLIRQRKAITNEDLKYLREALK